MPALTPGAPARYVGAMKRLAFALVAAVAFAVLAPPARAQVLVPPTAPDSLRVLAVRPGDVVKIQVWGDVIPVTARTGTAADKARVWPIMVKEWPGYDDYQANSRRNIPVVLLRRRHTAQPRVGREESRL